MMDKWDTFQGLPSGWDVRFDSRVGRYYFMDHVNKKTTWEDPRLKSCPPPPPHPDTLPKDLRELQENQQLMSWMPPLLGGRNAVYPSFAPYGLAFMPTYAMYGSVYPLQDILNINADKMRHVTTMDSMKTSDRSTSSTQQELSSLLDAIEHSQLSIAKISAMFPTVQETHIKDLMKKYHNREAVVISALQVQKYPLATPGPYGTFTPPPMRHFIPTAAAMMAMTPKSSVGVTGTPPVPPYITTPSSLAERIENRNRENEARNFAKPLYERAKGTHLLDEDKPGRHSPLGIGTKVNSLERSVGSPHYGGTRSSFDRSLASPRMGQGSLERSLGSPFRGRDSPLMSSRGSSPHTFLDGSPRPTTRSTSEVTRSLMGSPRPDFRHSPRPTPHSPRIKLRYLKGIFPKVDAVVILDVLTQCDYNVKDASEKLVELGHEKKETNLAPPKLKERPELEDLKGPPTPKPSPMARRPNNLTEQHKKKARGQLAIEFPALTPTVVTMALQSVLYDETRARQVLTNMAESDKKVQEVLANCTPRSSRFAKYRYYFGGLEVPTGGAVTDQGHHSLKFPEFCRRAEAEESIPDSISPPSLRRDAHKLPRPALPRSRVNAAWTTTSINAWTDDGNGSIGPEDDSDLNLQRNRHKGPDNKLHKGPSNGLLIGDYKPWHGPNPEYHSGVNRSLAKGSIYANRASSSLARGPDPALRRGPQVLAKGSQFLQSLRKEFSFSTKVM